MPTLIIRLVFPDQPYYLFVGGAAVGGHIWTVYHRFRGGGGISPALGVFLAVDPLGTLSMNILAMIIGFLIVREYLVSMMAGTWLMIPYLWIITGRWEYALFAFLVNAMLVAALIPDVSRYIRARSTGKVDLESSMDTIPMGRMMNKMMQKIYNKRRTPKP